mmetsp:Transcript_32405/g.49574  ORF Transcript_32405/g.49574 Transcript_32405/m.49574 type:complete len:114 (+) Transcript_32405:207-548(+)
MKGLKILGNDVKFLQSALGSCNVLSDDYVKLNKLADTMANPVQFAYMAGKDIIINHVNIYNDIQEAMRNNEKKDFKTAGLYIGRALALLFLGEANPIEDGPSGEVVDMGGWES